MYKRHDELQKAKATKIEHLLELSEIESVCVYSSLDEEVMRKFDILSQALEKKSQDILNAMELVSTTKESLNDFRNNGWDSLLEQVKKICVKHHMPNMKAPYTSTRYRPRKNNNQFTFEPFYRVDLFTSTLDKQLHKLNNRFNDHAMELLSLSFTLVSKEHLKVINADQICLLVEKYYPEDFTEQERIQLLYQLDIFNIDMTKNPRLSRVSTIADLCKGLVETQNMRHIICLIGWFVSTATTEMGFSAMKIFKNRSHNKMSDDFLTNNLVVYIEREIAENIDTKSVIDEFKDLKGLRA
uniref:HAT C-terminal dimerisation domain-containing protein n=1 Tax=Lactuca sativa TaxID=4236 RepID=A0A9R1UKT9_LACSA|nr:hypothetical protein LSAT_V11C900487320 [Lactuca sativa]